MNGRGRAAEKDFALMLARLKPYNPKKGHLTRIYMFDGNRFYEERGWYEVPDDLAEKLRGLHQEHYDEDSPDLFDVCTPEEAEALERRDAKALEVKSTPRAPANIIGERVRALNSRRETSESGDLTSDDVKQTPPKMVDPAEDEADAEADTDEDEGRAIEVGRVSPPAQAGRSTPPKPRTRR
jgi:hypothetical protein